MLFYHLDDCLHVLHMKILSPCKLGTNLGPFFLCLMSVAQQVADTVCSDDLKHEARGAINVNTTQDGQDGGRYSLR